MTDRVIKLAALSRERDLYEPCVKDLEYDPLDLALPEAKLNAKRIVEYILAQPVYITEDNRYTGMLRYDGAVVPSDSFHRGGHKHFHEACQYFFKQYHENLVTFEWQHAAPNYQYIVENGIQGSLKEIEFYKKQYQFDKEKFYYLEAVETVCNGIIAWAEKCAAVHEENAKNCQNPVRKNELLKLADICRRVLKGPAQSFYEGLFCIIFCFQFLPDSVGTIDRTLYPLYKKDMDNGVISREEAKELVAELFIHLSNHTPPSNVNGDRSAECHFAIGGYTDKGEDGFTDLSKLMVEALMEIDTRRPSISLRWNKKTPFEVLKFMLDCERKDKNKRFAFVNDEPRIKALMNICGFNYSEAVKYTMVGCNEPSFPGAVWQGGCTTNIVRSLTNTLYQRTEDIIKCQTFEEFFAIYKEELAKDIDRILWYHDQFNEMRAKDINVLSAFLLDGCIENATAPTQFGCKTKIGGFGMMGITCVIDSLTVITQFVFDEKQTDMVHLIDTLQSNWEKDEDLRTLILKTGKFFGNNEPISDEMARRLTTQLYELTKDRRLKCGAPILIGTLAGYNPHHMKYGAMTAATPDGRYDGDGLMVGTGQNNGKDRNGLLALMKSLAQMDPTGILCGPNVCNMMIDEKLIRNDEYFDKVCFMIEEYFKMGGIHVQLNYVTKEELIAARKMPEKYGNLKVRVSGYSASFVTLQTEHQDEIIMRTVKQ